MIIQHNITALNAYNRLSNNNSVVSKNLEKLSSGYRINRAGDDAAGLAISEKMRAQITGLERATLNAQDGISLVQTAEGALTEVHSMLNRMVELGTQSANGVYQAEDRQKIQSEVDALLGEIDRISQATNFNGINLLDGSLGLDASAFESTYTKAFSANSMTSIENIKLGKASATAAKGTYTLDLGNLTVAKDATGSLVLNVAGKEVTIALNSSGTGTTEKLGCDGAGALKVNAGETTGYSLDTNVVGGISQADLTTKLSKIISNVLTDKNDATVVIAAKLNGQALTFDATTAGKIEIEQTALPTGDSTTIDIDKIFKVSTATATGVTGDVVHGVRVDSISTAPTTSSKAEADIRFDVSTLRNGSTLTIGDKTFKFITKDAGVAANTAGDVDLTAYTEADLAAMEKSKLEKLVGASVDKAITANGGHAPAEWNVTVNNDGSLHLDQKHDSSVTFANKADIVSQFTSTTTSKNAGVSIEIDELKLRKGTSIKIGDNVYEFTDDAKNVSDKNAIAVVVKGLTENGNNSKVGTATDALAKAVTGANGAVASVDPNNLQKLNILAGKAEEASPAVGGKGLTLQIGDTADSFNQVTVAVDDMGTRGLGIEGLKVTDQGWSQESIDKIKGAIEKVSVNRGNLGALQNRLEHTINNLTTTTENMTAAESRIRDTDMAKEMMDFTKNNVLVQAAQAMLAQANQQPQQVLQLLR